VDATDFYAACEVLFDPSLAGKPWVVLFSNDGCVVVRSAEAAALGITTGAPGSTWPPRPSDGVGEHRHRPHRDLGEAADGDR